MPTIAILDDGICSSSFPHLGQVKKSLAITDDGSIIHVNEPERITHGTLCAAIVRSYAPDAELVSIRVLDPVTKKGSISQVRYALDWCITHHISLINLSVGCISFKDWNHLQSTIACLAKNNIPLICAGSNNEIPSIFSDFSWPISVEKDDVLLENQYYPKNGNFLECDYCASSTHTLITSENVPTTFSSQNSHAAPVISAKVYQLINEYGKLPINVLHRLLQHGVSNNVFHIKPLPDFIDTAVVIGNPLFSHDLFFFHTQQGSSISSSFLAIFPNRSVSVSMVKKILHSHRSKLQGILYAGIAPWEIKKIAISTGCLFWDESAYVDAATKLPQSLTTSPALIINFRGINTSTIRFARLLQDKLIEVGYRSKTFSDWPQSYCLGMIYLTAPINSAKYIYAFSDFYQLDVIMLCSNSIDIKSDMVISYNNSSVFLEFDSIQKEYCTNTVSEIQIIEEVISLLL